MYKKIVISCAILLISILGTSFAYATSLMNSKPSTNYSSVDSYNLINDAEATYKDKNEETGYQIIIEDDADLFESPDFSNLTDIMFLLSKYGNVYLKTIDYNSLTTERYAHDCYYDIFRSNSGCVFLIDMYHREIYIHTDGEFRQTITDSKARTITDNIYIYAKQGNYGLCAYKAFEQMNQLFEGQAIAEPMRYICAALVSIVSGFLLTFLYIFKNSRIQKAQNQEIIYKAIVKFNVTNIHAEKAGERRVYSPISTSSSGSSFSGGGHGSGGGGHSSHSSHGSGGGGGHGF